MELLGCGFTKITLALSFKSLLMTTDEKYKLFNGFR